MKLLPLSILWLGLAAVTLWAIASLGLPGAADTFVSDLRHPWRAQFYADLEIHLILFGSWIAWREGWRPRAFVMAAATLVLGALFTLPYLIVAARQAAGDPMKLLGRPARR